jgi:hypothetical protein
MWLYHYARDTIKRQKKEPLCLSEVLSVLFLELFTSSYIIAQPCRMKQWPFNLLFLQVFNRQYQHILFSKIDLLVNRQDKHIHLDCLFVCLFVCLMVLNATFNNISVIGCRSDFLVEETGGSGIITYVQLYCIVDSNFYLGLCVGCNPLVLMFHQCTSTHVIRTPSPIT